MDGIYAEFGLKESAPLPREYQVNIARSILKRGNSLVVLPTALGKTYIAVLVMGKFLKEMAAGERERKKLLFLAPTKPLAAQHAERLGEFLQLQEGDAALLTGEMAPEKRKGVWNGGTAIFFATPQTVEFDLLAGRMALEDFSLVVFDEAHRTVKEYSYSFIAKEAAARGLLLIGLTASPSSKREVIDEICLNLQIANIEARTEKDGDVLKYTHRIKTDWVFLELPMELKKIRHALQEMLLETLYELKELGALKEVDLRSHKRSLLELRGRALENLHKDAANYRILSLQAKAMNLSHAADLVEIEGVHSLLQFIREMKHRVKQSKAVRVLLEDFRLKLVESACEELLSKGQEHPKFAKLVGVLREQLRGGERAIVFSHYRNTIDKILLEMEKSGIRAVKFIGKGRGGMKQREQQGVLQKFRDGEYDVLVATSVAEEGLDIPEVGLVVFFEAVPSEIRLIQRRGRTGRLREGGVVVLITRGSKDEAFYWASKSKERKMLKMVEEMRQTGALPVEEQDDLIMGSQKRMFDY